jgi:predicted enzyme related to lactoylglutathione lyase
MQTIVKTCVVLLCMGLCACSNSKVKNEKVEVSNVQNSDPMKSLVSIIEIPTANFPRAVTFYKAVLGVDIEEVNMDGTRMGVLPSNGDAVSVVLVSGNDYKPSIEGSVVYLNAGADLAPTLMKVQTHGGEVLVPKTEISPEMGYFALFLDSEGNKLGLHSQH